MKSKGFTYIEVMIGFAIFSILVIFAVKLDHTANDSIRYQNRRIKMMYVAQMALEAYKSERNTFENDNYEGYYVKVEKKPVIENVNGRDITITEVKVTVKGNRNDSDTDAVVLYNHFDG